MLNGGADLRGPRALHPAFYGSFDWHSSVHGHWMLVRLLRRFPDLPERQQIRAVLGRHLTADNLQAEADYFAQPNRQSFERTYGWAWLLKLAEELHGWDDSDGRQWSRNMRPLADAIAARSLSYFSQADVSDPHRGASEHGLRAGFRAGLRSGRGPQAAGALIEERSRFYFAKDAAVPAGWEPGGTDFLSPSLIEADLMRRVLPPAEFRDWLRRFLPDLARGEPRSLLLARPW